VSYEEQELFPLHGHLGSSFGFGGVCVVHPLRNCFAFALCRVCIMLPVSLDCSFLFSSSVFP
jgi:hypothetical protein